MSKRESNSDRIKCELQGSKAIIRASDTARAFGEAQSLAEDDCARFCIVIEELVANLYEHGGLTNEDKVEMGFARKPDGILITITDPGKPFDPRSPTLDRERPERGGGAGLDLIRSWARVVDYAVTTKGNRLELVLPV